MVCRLNSLNPLDALYRACQGYPGGIEALAARLGRSPATMYNKLRHQVDTHRVGYDKELSELLFCLAEAKVEGWADTIHAFAWRHGHVAVPVPALATSSDEQAALICRVVKETADAVGAFGTALENDHQIDSKEFEVIDRETEEAIAALVALRNRAKAMRDEAVGRGLVR